MDRHDMLLKLKALKLHGMAAAFDEVIDEGINMCERKVTSSEGKVSPTARLTGDLKEDTDKVLPDE